MHPIGDRWRVVRSPEAGRGGLALLETEGKSILQGQGRKGVCFLQEKKSWEQVLGDQGGKGGVYSLGCGDSTGGQKEGV